MKFSLTTYLSGILCIAAFWGVVVFFLRGAGPMPQLGFAHDVGVLLDAGWRFCQGQMPHRDYFSPLGPVYAALAGIPMWLNGVSYQSLDSLPTIIGFAFTVFAFCAIYGSCNVFIVVSYSILTGLVAGGTYHMGWPSSWTTFATFYNRPCWGLLMILSMACLLPKANCGKTPETVSGVVCGALLALVLFLKVTFFGAGCLIVIAAVLFGFVPIQSRFLAAMLIGCALTTCFCLVAISWDVAGIIRDLSYAAAARRDSFFTAEKYWNPGTKLLSNSFGLIFAGCVAASLFLAQQRRAGAFVVGLCCLGYAMTITNSSGDGAGIPLIMSALVFGCVSLFSEGTASEHRSQAKVLSWGAVAALGVSSIIIPQVTSWITWIAASRAIQQKELAAFNETSGPMHGFSENGNNQWGAEFSSLVKEGTALIRQSVPDGKTLMYVDFTNPFNFASKAKSPRNTLLWYDENGSLARVGGGHPEAGVLFGDVDYVMIPKRPMSMDGVGIWMDLYRPYLEAHYGLVKESANFWMFGRQES